MCKITVILVISLASLTLSFIINAHHNLTENSADVTIPRTIDKTVELLFNFYDMVNDVKKSLKKPPSTRKQQVIPYDGLNYDQYNNQPTWEDHNIGQEIEVVKKEKKKPEPQFWVFDNFAKKNNLLLMTKVLLKLIIFKKIVKFIALVCLLFFVPTLKDTSATNSTSSEENHSEYSRKIDVYDQIDYRTKEILAFALNVIEGFSADVMVWCVGEHDAFCRFRTMFDNIDQAYTIDR